MQCTVAWMVQGGGMQMSTVISSVLNVLSHLSFTSLLYLSLPFTLPLSIPPSPTLSVLTLTPDFSLSSCGTCCL